MLIKSIGRLGNGLAAIVLGGLLAAGSSLAGAAPLSGPSGGPAQTAALANPRYVTAPPGYGEVHVIILGVTAPFFVFGITKRFQEIPGVEKVTFILEEGLADVWIKPGAHVTDEDLKKAVRSASFSLGRIIWIKKPADTPMAKAAASSSSGLQN
jgi:hypothetical protein